MGATVSIVPPGELAYGMQLPVQALSSRVAMPWEAEGTVDDIVEVARACEGAGFLYVAACHHVAIPSEPAATMSTQWFDPIPTLAYVAAHTARTRLMTNVYVAPYRHPLESAKAFATLDALSSGRLIVGLGAGHVQGEFEALGVTFAQRGALMDEALDALLGALTDEWPVHDGKQWRYADVGQRPRPVQQPHPPVWIGGSARPALRRVASHGDGWIPQATPLDQLAADIAWIRRERDRVRPGAVPELGYHLAAYVGEPAWDLPRGVLHGAPGRIVEFANERLGALGISHLQVRLPARSRAELCEQIAAFGAEVGPHLRRVALD